MEFAQLAERIVASNTVLFLGAGASMPSGCPSGSELAVQLAAKLDPGKAYAPDLTETASILELRYGRRALVDATAQLVGTSVPVGGLLALPDFEWPVVYTTNFDTLIEQAYKQRGRECVPVRSDFDYPRLETERGTPLFKLHGCVTNDRAWGHRASMILTEEDYESFRQYREILHRRLSLDLVSRPLLFVGYSLSDPHVRFAATEAAKIQREVGQPGRLFALLFTRDDDRARLLEARGYSVAFGGIDDLVAAMAARGVHTHLPPRIEVEGTYLPTAIASTCIAVASAKKGRSNLKKVFSGSSATYADIHAGGTFARIVEQSVLRQLSEGRLIASIVGAAGVGKTTLARRLAYHLDSDGWLALEHQPDTPLHVEDWLDFIRAQTAADRRVILFIDSPARSQRAFNQLLTGILESGSSSAKLIITAESHEWNTRQKAAAVFSHGHVERLSGLAVEDIRDLLRLAHQVDAAHHLMDRAFRSKSSAEQERILRGRCGSDMYVCLKNIFASDSLDTIILREFASLPGDLQEIYRHVAALHAAGATPHRQLLIRLLGVPADGVSTVLKQLEDIIDERAVDEREGIYEWLTRHEVVARTLCQYKFADQDELFRLLMSVIVSTNPTVYIEQQALRGLCNWDFGIRRVESMERRIELYETILRVSPSERIARHRLVGEYLSADQFDLAETSLTTSVKVVGLDAPLSRYRVRLLLLKAERLPGIQEVDRRALLIQARGAALDTTRRFPDNRFGYEVLGDVAVAWRERTQSNEFLDEALAIIEKGAERTLDPELERRRRGLERIRTAT